LGIQSIHDIPDDFPLNERQRCACTCVQTGQPCFSADIKEELSGLKYPIFFMDFETVNPAIPRFKWMRPYDQLPFQWSVHVLREPGTKLEHFEFLAMDTNDPRHEFIGSLCTALGKSGSIVDFDSDGPDSDAFNTAGTSSRSRFCGCSNQERNRRECSRFVSHRARPGKTEERCRRRFAC
jgi:hypothetical protein